MTNTQFKTQRFLVAVFVSLLLSCFALPALAQQTNPNRLPPCPKPDYLKKTDHERFATWTNCWGRYQIELEPKTNGDILEGEWLSGLQHGVGKYTYSNRNLYIGKFRFGIPDGRGTFYSPNGDKYVGEFIDNKFNGFGTFRFANGNKYSGEWIDGLPSGRGIYTKKNGKTVEGIWDNERLIRKEKINIYMLIIESDERERERKITRYADRTIALAKKLRENDQAKDGQKIYLDVRFDQPNADGSFLIDIQTGINTTSLKVNGEEQGRHKDGKYLVHKIARVGGTTQFVIVATDIKGNTDTKTITVSRQVVESKAVFAALNPANIKKQVELDAVAVVIGIADYRSLPKAEFANDDARAFYDYAIRALGIKPENIKLLVDGDAEEAEILKTFRTWLPSRVKSTTEVFVFYSGHGLPTADGKGLYLLPPRADREVIDDTAIPFSKINAAIQIAKPKSVTVILDACYSDQSRSGETLVANARPVAMKIENRLFPENFTVFSASQSDQISSSSPDLKHGIFSYYLMKGMEGDADANSDGKITLGEMQIYLTENVGRHAATISRKQEPQLIGDTNRILVGR